MLLQTEPDGSVVAKGVQFRKDGQLYEAHSKGEVVLSAGERPSQTVDRPFSQISHWTTGIFQTPQLLELSGECLAGQPKPLSLKIHYDHLVLGIGRRHILNKFGIEQVLELPVGENLRTSQIYSFNTTELNDKYIVFADAAVTS